jgi:hypothetical protein
MTYLENTVFLSRLQAETSLDEMRRWRHRGDILLACVGFTGWRMRAGYLVYVWPDGYAVQFLPSDVQWTRYSPLFLLLSRYLY